MFGTGVFLSCWEAAEISVQHRVVECSRLHPASSVILQINQRGLLLVRAFSPRPIALCVPASRSHRELAARPDGHILDTRLVHRLRDRRACKMHYSGFIGQANEPLASSCPYLSVESFTHQRERLQDFSCEACRGHKRATKLSLFE